MNAQKFENPSILVDGERILLATGRPAAWVFSTDDEGRLR